MKKKYLSVFVLPVIIYVVLSITNILLKPESLFKNYVQNFFKKQQIEVYVKNPHYKNLFSFEFDELVVRKSNGEIDSSFRDVSIKLLRSGFDIGFSGFDFKSSKVNLFSNSQVNNKIYLKFDYSLNLKNMDVLVDSISFNSNEFVGNVLGVGSTGAKSIRINGVSVVGENDKNSYKAESNYFVIDILDLNLKNASSNIKLNAPNLQTSFSGLSLALYDFCITFSNTSKNGITSKITSQSMDLLNLNNVLLTLDDVSTTIVVKDLLKVDFNSNLINGDLQFDLSQLKGNGKLTAFSSGIVSDFEIDLSSPNLPKGNVSTVLDFKLPFLNTNLKGDFNLLLNGNRVFVTSNGMSIGGDINLTPYLDFDLNEENKNAYLNINYKKAQYCVAKLNFLSQKSLPKLNLSFPDYSYDIDIRGERRKYYITSPDVFNVVVDYFKTVKVKANINDLRFPVSTPTGFKDVTLSLNSSFETGMGDIRVESSDVSVKFDDYMMSSRLSYIKNILNIDSFVFNDKGELWQGMGTAYVPKSLDPKEFTFNFTFFQPTGDGRLMLSCNKNGTYSDYLFRADNVKANLLNRVGMSELNSSVNIRTDFKHLQMANGYIKSLDNDGDDFLSGIIDFDGKNVNLKNAYFDIKGIKFRDLNLIIDASNKSVNLDGDMIFPYRRFDRTLDFRSHVNTNLGAGDIDLENFVKTLSSLDLKGNISLTNVMFDDIFFPDFNAELNYSKSTLNLKGDNIKVFANINKESFLAEFSISDPASPIIFDANIKKQNDTFWASLDLKHVSNRLITAFLVNPIINFYKGDIIGWASVKSSGFDIDMRCNLHADELVFDNIWLEKERFTVNDVSIIATGRSLELTCQSANSMNVLSKRFNPISKFRAGMYFEKGDMIPFWLMDVSVPSSSAVQVNMPIIPANFTLDIGKANGDFYISGRGMGDIGILADLFVEDVSMSTPSRHPKWFFQKNPKTGTVKNVMDAPIEFTGTITCGKNVSLSYPSPENALFNATIKPGSSSKVFYSDRTGEISIETPIELERGEVFYFNKKFVIEEGSFSWPQKRADDYLALDSNDMKLNITSSLHDSDDAGKPIDLYLILKNATIDNIKPLFSASVPMSQAEILYKFGQNIYNTANTNREENYKAGADLALNATMALGTLGGVANFTLGGNFGSKLGLDIWTFRSAVLTQFIADSGLTLAGRSYSKSTSSFARYLDKTSITLGKNFDKSQSLNLQLEFRNITNPLVKLKGVELTTGVYLGFDLAYRWNSPMARLEFSSSLQDLSIPSVLENFKISINRSFSL